MVQYYETVKIDEIKKRRYYRRYLSTIATVMNVYSRMLMRCCMPAAKMYGPSQSSDAESSADPAPVCRGLKPHQQNGHNLMRVQEFLRLCCSPLRIPMFGDWFDLAWSCGDAVARQWSEDHRSVAE